MMVIHPAADDRVEVEYVDGSRKRVRRARLGELSSRWTVVGDQADAVDLEPAAVEVEPPAKSASKAEWTQYALDRGASPEALEGKTKAELVDEYGPGGSDSGGDAGEE
jgi:hypothetical protein